MLNACVEIINLKWLPTAPTYEIEAETHSTLFAPCSYIVIKYSNAVLGSSKHQAGLCFPASVHRSWRDLSFFAPHFYCPTVFCPSSTHQRRESRRRLREAPYSSFTNDEISPCVLHLASQLFGGGSLCSAASNLSTSCRAFHDVSCSCWWKEKEKEKTQGSSDRWIIINSNDTVCG